MCQPWTGLKIWKCTYLRNLKVLVFWVQTNVRTPGLKMQLSVRHAHAKHLKYASANSTCKTIQLSCGSINPFTIMDLTWNPRMWVSFAIYFWPNGHWRLKVSPTESKSPNNVECQPLCMKCHPYSLERWDYAPNLGDRSWGQTTAG